MANLEYLLEQLLEIELVGLKIRGNLALCYPGHDLQQHADLLVLIVAGFVQLFDDVDGGEVLFSREKGLV